MIDTYANPAKRIEKEVLDFNQSIVSGEIVNFVSFSWVQPTAGVASRWQNLVAVWNLALFVIFRQFYICLQNRADRPRFVLVNQPESVTR